MVAALRNGLAELLVAARRLRGGARQRRHHRVLGRGRPSASSSGAASTSCFGEFSSKFAARAPRRAAPRRRPSHRADRRHAPRGQGQPDVDAYCLTHNETSTGVAMPLRAARGRRRRSCWSTPPRRPAGCASTRRRSTPTTSPRRSAWPPTAGCGWRPCRRPRSSASSASRRPTAGCPAFLDLGIALDNSRKDQTYNTPALATIFLAAQQVEWILEQRRPGVGRRRAATARPRSSTAGPRPATTPRRSSPTPPRAATWSPPSTSTTSVDATTVSRRSCGPTASSTPRPTASWAATSCASRCSPPIDPDDVDALTRCIDHVVAPPPRAEPAATPDDRHVTSPARSRPCQRRRSGDDAIADLRARLARTRWPDAGDRGRLAAGRAPGLRPGPVRLLGRRLRLRPGRPGQRLPPGAGADRRPGGPRPARPLARARRPAARAHPRLARLGGRVPRRPRPAHRPAGPRRRPGRRLPRRGAVAAGLRLERRADRARAGTSTASPAPGSPSWTPSATTARRPGRRLGRGGDRQPGRSRRPTGSWAST